MSIIIQGKGISAGLCTAKILKYSRKIIRVPTPKAVDVEVEINRFRTILAAEKEELEALYEDSNTKFGQKETDIFDTYLSILGDECSVTDPIEELIRIKHWSAVKAIEIQFNKLVDLFQSLDDELHRKRIAGTASLKKRLMKLALEIYQPKLDHLEEDVIIVAQELDFADIAQIDFAHVAGIATCLGSLTSYAAILSGTLGIPAVSGIRNLNRLNINGMNAILDGDDGVLLISPTNAETVRYRKKQQEAAQYELELHPYLNARSIAPDGSAFYLCANIGLPAETEKALSGGADGIGLFRSEFLFMNCSDIPSEEEQYWVYRNVLEKMEGRTVTIRTLDIGGDKKISSLKLSKEANPLLGYRAIRICLDRPELFHPQLRALLRAAPYGRLRILFPMISGLTELRQAKAALAECRKELEQEGIAFGNVSIGAMIEIPAAAIQADLLAREVDFFSIGTNDLIQYTTAAECGNKNVNALCTPYHPAVLRLIAITAAAAVKNNIMCGICGEAAGYRDLIPVWAGLGLRELSMSPRMIAQARQIICNLDINATVKRAEELLNAQTPEHVLQLLHDG